MSKERKHMLEDKFCLETINGELRFIIQEYLKTSGLSRIGLIENMKRKGIPASRRTFDRIMHEKKFVPESLTIAKILGYFLKTKAIDETVHQSDGYLGQYLRHEIPLMDHPKRSDSFRQSSIKLENELGTFEKFLIFALASTDHGVTLEFLKDTMVHNDPIIILSELKEKQIITEVTPNHWHCNLKEVNFPPEFIQRYLPEMSKFFKMNRGKYSEFRKLYFHMNSTSKDGLKMLVDLSYEYEKKKMQIFEKNKGSLPVFSFNIIETTIPEMIAPKYLNYE